MNFLALILLIARFLPVAILATIIIGRYPDYLYWLFWSTLHFHSHCLRLGYIQLLGNILVVPFEIIMEPSTD